MGFGTMGLRSAPVALVGRVCARKTAILMTTTALVAFSAAAPAMAQAEPPAQAFAAGVRHFEIPAQPLATAINTFGRQSGMQVTAEADVTAGVQAQAVSGDYQPVEALSHLLTGTGVTWRMAGSNIFVLTKAPQTSGSAIQLGPVRVEGAGATATTGNSAPLTVESAVTERTHSYTTNAVTIGKTVLNPRDIPQSVSVVTRQRIEDQNLFTLTDALAQSPGVTVTSSGTQRNSFTVRGFGIDNIQIDGLPTTYNFNTTLNPDLVMYDRVEIIRGANGLLEGAGDPSAAINLVRKRPTDTLAISGALSAGSWSNYRAEADVGGPLNSAGTLRARLVGSFQDNDYFYDVAHQRSWVLYGIVDLALSEATKITAGYTYSGSRSTPDYDGVPRYSDGGDLHLPRSTYLGASWDRQRYNNQEEFVELNQEIGSRWSAKAVFRHGTYSVFQKIGFTQGAVDRNTGTGPTTFASVNTPYRDHQNGVDAFVSGSVDLLGRTHTLLVGVSAREDNFAFTNQDFSLDGYFAPVDVFNFDPKSIPEPTAYNAVPFFNFASKTRQAGIYGTARISLADPLTLVLGARVSWFEQNTAYLAPAVLLVDGTHMVKNGVFTPYAGLVYKVKPNISLYASYADIFQPQTGIEYPNKGIPPIIGANYEAGIKAGFLNDKLNATFAIFQIDQTNRALNDPDRPCGSFDPICYVVPSGKVRSRGFEAELTGEITPQWSISTGYTFTETKYLRDSDNQGNSFNPFTPRNLFRFWTDYTLPGQFHRWAIGGGLQVQSKSYVQSGTVRVTQGSYALANLRVAYDINSHLKISANLNNIFDKTYYKSLSSTTSSNFYGEPRNFTISLRGKF